jgi:hypothetical protein
MVNVLVVSNRVAPANEGEPIAGGLAAALLPFVVVTLLYEVPKFKGNRIVNSVLGGWKVGLLETYESGPVFTVITASNTTNAFPAGALRPNVSGDPSLPSDQRTAARWFDTSAFSQPAASM